LPVNSYPSAINSSPPSAFGYGNNASDWTHSGPPPSDVCFSLVLIEIDPYYLRPPPLNWGALFYCHPVSPLPLRKMFSNSIPSTSGFHCYRRVFDPYFPVSLFPRWMPRTFLLSRFFKLLVSAIGYFLNFLRQVLFPLHVPVDGLLMCRQPWLSFATPTALWSFLFPRYT